MSDKQLQIQENIAGKLENQGYQGIDQSLTTSLFEQGLVGKKENSDYHVIYKANYNKTYYVKTTLSSHFIADCAKNFVNKGFLDFIGMDFQDWCKLPFYTQLFDLVNYHGHLNIFGDPYNAKTLEQLKELV